MSFLWTMDSFLIPDKRTQAHLTSLLASVSWLNISIHVDLANADEYKPSRLPPKRLACQCLKWSICDSAAGSCWLLGRHGVDLPRGSVLMRAPRPWDRGNWVCMVSVRAPLPSPKQRPPPRQAVRDRETPCPQITALIHWKGLFNYWNVECVL